MKVPFTDRPGYSCVNDTGKALLVVHRSSFGLCGDSDGLLYLASRKHSIRYVFSHVKFCEDLFLCLRRGDNSQDIP